MQQETAALDQEVEQIVKTNGIPTCPAILTKLVREMRDDDPDFAKIGRMIGGDVGLAAAMLKTVNSPFYGLRTKATSVAQALALLGLRNVAQLVTGLLLRQAFSGADSREMEEYWESSSGIALIAAWLAPKVKGANRDDAYTFALFRDCGVPVLMTTFDYEPAPCGAADPAAVLAAEHEAFGVDHTALGYQLATSWLLPDATCQAVLAHHNYADPDLSTGSARLIAIALAAEWLYTMHKNGRPCREWAVASEFALGQLDKTQDELKALLPEIRGVLAS